MKRLSFIIAIGLLVKVSTTTAQEKRVFPGADERTPSRSEYFSWINNTNEGATAEQTMVNLEFFKWLHDEYGMVLDIYAFDAGAIDGKRFYGSTSSDRFKRQFPEGFDPIYRKAAEMGTRLGVWGGPDGFGETPEEEAARTEQMVSLCRDLDFALFKFDAVCGPLRPEKENAFINMMELCRQYSPDLILLNHRLGLERAQAYATTFLWEGWETYIDVFMCNDITAPHHRAGALSRGLPPDLQRLTEDHGVCISSCPDYWDDDLVLQAFNRSLILSPQIYGNPWLLRDDEYPKLARLFNLHRSYRDIMVEGRVLPEEIYGPHAVSRGDKDTRIITLRNLTWNEVEYNVRLDSEIGLENGREIELRQFHPYEKIFTGSKYGDVVKVVVPPFRSCLLIATNRGCQEPGIEGALYQVVRDVPGRPVEIDLLGLPGSKAEIRVADFEGYSRVTLSGKDSEPLLKGKKETIKFPGDPLKQPLHRLVSATFTVISPDSLDWRPLYEATTFRADNNALEVRSLERSGPSSVPQVIKAREAFFSQEVFTGRGIWDRNLFDGDTETSYWPSVRKYNRDQRISGGCLRLDLSKETELDSLVISVPDDYSLQPLLRDEGNWVEVSRDLVSWDRITYLAGTTMKIELDSPYRYFRFTAFPDRISEITGYYNGQEADRGRWSVSNLFSATGSAFSCRKVWKTIFTLDEIGEGAYLSIALNGVHGVEGAYVAARIDGQYIGSPDRSPSYPSNSWEYINCRSDANYTYYIPMEKSYLGKEIEIYVMSFDSNNPGIDPSVWISSEPVPYRKVRITLSRNN